ncbi:GIY-YIG catalytic domain-containing endonuclease [Paramecium bursaria Chlorella virus AP110A]|nr:GIY-YIG catalytic domain-containing endonuclease [Paramecium bursaria Chlorella virus AP110A]
MLILSPKRKHEYFPYDVTMFWEFFRWERYNIGHIYMQSFPNGKLYAGQSVCITDRMYAYKGGRGANPHHSNAIKCYGWNNVNVTMVECPQYMLDTIEIFLIAYYELTNPKKGYNKSSGGRKHWQHSKESRAKISAAGMGRSFSLESCAKKSTSMTGKNNPMTGKTGKLHHLFGTKLSREQIAKMSGKNSFWFGKTGALSPNSKPICVLGKVYPCSKDASDDLRATHAPKNKTNFIKDKWPYTKKRKSCMFKVTKTFYEYVIENEIENVTRDLYDIWSAFNNNMLS